MIRLIPLLILLACETGAARGQRERRAVEEVARKTETARAIGNLRGGEFNLRYYEDVTVGMDLATVTAYLGASGREVSTATEAGRTTAVHEWSGTGGAISVTFVDGAVTSKSKRED